MILPVLQMNDICKEYGAVRALNGANFEVRGGEIHALLGENGSGKTTLMRVLQGDVQTSSGTIRVEGKHITLRRPKDARKLGIGLVYQEPNLGPDLTVGENIMMGKLPGNGKFVKAARIKQAATMVIDDIGFPLNANDRVSSLSPDQRQLVEIARVAAGNPSILALDEPTASLTGDQVEVLFKYLRRLRDHGCAIIYISHRLHEVIDLCDRVTVLRDGTSRGTELVSETNENELIKLMVGRELGQVHRTNQVAGSHKLETRKVSRGNVLHSIDIKVSEGEIVGIAGLVGAGRSALLRTLFGLRRIDSGQILIDGVEVDIHQPRHAIQLGMGLVPEDRLLSGLCMDLTIRENISLPAYGIRGLRGLARIGASQETAALYINNLPIKASGPASLARELSGGNQQKVVLARWLSRDTRLLLLDEPTRGVDVGAKAEIYRLLDGLAGDGVAMLLSSSELPELLTLCDRIYAMYKGRIVAEFSRELATEEGLARAISGVD